MVPPLPRTRAPLSWTPIDLPCAVWGAARACRATSTPEGATVAATCVLRCVLRCRELPVTACLLGLRQLPRRAARDQIHEGQVWRGIRSFLQEVFHPTLPMLCLVLCVPPRTRDPPRKRGHAAPHVAWPTRRRCCRGMHKQYIAMTAKTRHGGVGSFSQPHGAWP